MHTQRNSVCACLPIHLKPEFLLGSAYLIAEFLSKLYVERYNRTVRHEWMEMNDFATIEEAQLTATQWLWIYNNERPSMALGGITPAMKLAKALKLKPSTAGSC